MVPLIYAAAAFTALACPLHFSLPFGVDSAFAAPKIVPEKVERLVFDVAKILRASLSPQWILADLRPSGQKPRTLQPFDEIVCERDSRFAISRNGQRLAIGGTELRMIEVMTRRTFWTLPNGSPYRFSADGRTLYVHLPDRFATLDSNTGKQLFELPGAQCLDISRDGKLMAFHLASNKRRVPNEMAIWDVEKKDFVGRRNLPKEVPGFCRFTFAPDGTWGLATGNDYTLGATSSNSHQYAMQVPSLETIAQGSCELPNGQRIGSSSIGGQLAPENSQKFVVWGNFGVCEVERTDKSIRLDHRRYVKNLPRTSRNELCACQGVSPDGRLAIVVTRDETATNDSGPRIVEAATGDTVARLEPEFGMQYEFADGGKLMLRRFSRIVGKEQGRDVWRMGVQIYKLP